MKKISGKVVMLLFVLAIPTIAHATPGVLKLFVKAYPDAATTQLGDCRTCHLPANENFLNPYAQSLKEGNFDFAAIEEQDADMDGKSNIVEIKAGDLPGSQAGADEVFLFTNRMGTITFNHEGHSLAPRYGIKGQCDTCHGPDIFPRRFNDTEKWQTIAHKVCKGCHGKDESSNAPRKCRECHIKK